MVVAGSPSTPQLGRECFCEPQYFLSWNSRRSRQDHSAPDPGTWSTTQAAGAWLARSSLVLPRGSRAFLGQFLLPPWTQGPPPSPGLHAGQSEDRL